MLRWLLALVASSTTFALADVLCDVCITENDAEGRTVETAADDDDYSEQGSGIELASQTSDDQDGQARHRKQGSPRYHRDRDLDVNRTPMPARYKALGELSKSFEELHNHDDREAGLSGAQDAAIAGACQCTDAAHM